MCVNVLRLLFRQHYNDSYLFLVTKLLTLCMLLLVLYVSFIFVHGLFQSVCSHFMLGRTFYYRAMHFSAKRGIAIACRLSVCDVGEL